MHGAAHWNALSAWLAGGTVVISDVTERFDPVELALGAQEVDELDAGRLAVQVGVEVEQVGLEQRVVGVLVERGAPAKVDGAAMTRPIGA